MADEKMPEQPRTARFAAADKNEILLAELKVLVVNGFAHSDANDELQRGQIEGLQRQIDVLFEFKTAATERLRQNSDRARAGSNADLSLESKLAATIVEQQELKTAIVETRAIVEAQSDFMGMGKRGLQWVGSKEGRTALAQAAAAFVGVYEVLRMAGILK